MWFISHNIPKRNKLAEKISQKNPEYMLNYSLPCSYSYNLSSFWLILKQQRMEGGAVGHNIKRGPPKFALIWFSGFREDLNVIFYQNMPNLHIRYKSAERIISQKTRYDYNLTIMRSPKPATDTIYPHIKFWWYRTMLNLYPPFLCRVLAAILKMADILKILKMQNCSSNGDLSLCQHLCLYHYPVRIYQH